MKHVQCSFTAVKWSISQNNANFGQISAKIEDSGRIYGNTACKGGDFDLSDKQQGLENVPDY